MTDEDAELRKLRWRARRGMRELDQLFTRFLDQRWAQSPEAERATFRRLLECEDDRLWRWFMGFDHADDPDLDALVQRMRNLPEPRDSL